MSLGKQAKTLSKGQIEATLGYLAKTRYPVRNRVIFLLSIKAGLRAKEIAFLTWEMITDGNGEIGWWAEGDFRSLLTDMSLRHCVDPVRLSAADPEILKSRSPDLIADYRAEQTCSGHPLTAEVKR